MLTHVAPNGKGLGWLPQLPDQRDFRMALAPIQAGADFQVNPAFLSPVRDQGQRGACAAFATTGAMRFVYEKEGFHHPFPPAEDFQYYNVRRIQGTTDYDSGSSIRGNFQAAMQWGMCDEHWFPYSDDPATIATPPPADAYVNATHHKTTQYQRVPQAMSFMTSCLAAGFPFVIGFTVYDNFFQTGPDGIVPKPAGSVRGGHAVLVVGYEYALRAFRFQNTWGTGWAAGGFAYLSEDVLTDPTLSSDFWTVRAQH